MRVVVFVIPEKGHTNPLLPTVRHLAQRGHDVTVLSTRDLLPSAAGERVTSGRAFAERLRDAAWLSQWVEGLLLDAVPALVAQMEERLRTLAPDVVIADPMLYAAAIACARLHIPWAALSSSLNPVTPPGWRTALTDTLARMHPRRCALFADHGVTAPRFFVSDAESPWLNVVFTTDAYADPRAADNARVFAVGAPFDDDERRTRDANLAAPLPLGDGARRRVYCSFGSQAFHQPALFTEVFAAAAALELQVIASVGDLADDAPFVARAPPAAILLRSAAQLQVLAHVDAVVTHGGANTVVESLAFDRPLVVLPLCNDQPLQARFVEAAGVGVVLDPEGADADTLAAALRRALHGDVSARAAQVGASLRGAGGPARAATLVEQLARERRPLSFHEGA